MECDPIFSKTACILFIGATNAGKSYFANKLISKHADKFTDIIVCGVYASELEKCEIYQKSCSIVVTYKNFSFMADVNFLFLLFLNKSKKGL